MKLLKLRTYQDLYYFVSQEDWHGPRYQTLVPTRCKTGQRHCDLPRGERPQSVAVHRENVVEIEDGPWVDWADFPNIVHVPGGSKAAANTQPQGG